MISQTLVNGHLANSISLNDRGFNYGDGLFETIKVIEGRPCFLEKHLKRLESGLERLSIEFSQQLLIEDIQKLLSEAKNQDEAVIKVVVTRGDSQAGYKPQRVAEPNRVVSITPARHQSFPETGVVLRLCSTRLGINPLLAGMKHLCRIEQVMARAEWSNPDIHEGVMLDVDGNVIEGTMSNIFCIINGKIITPSIDGCGVAGIVRGLVLESIAPLLHLDTSEVVINLDQLKSADEVFITNSLLGIVPVVSFEKQSYEYGHLTKKIKTAYQSLINE